MTTLNGESLAEALGADYEDSYIHCVGWAKTQHRECYNAIAKSNRLKSTKEWDRICTILDRPEEVKEALEDQATRLLCKRWHRDQYLTVAGQWHTKLQDYIRRQAQQQARTRPTRRTPQQVQDTPDSGYESTTSTLANDSEEGEVEIEVEVATARLRPRPRPAVRVVTTAAGAAQQDDEATPIARQPTPQASADHRSTTGTTVERQSSFDTFAALEAELATMSLEAPDPDEVMLDVTEGEEGTTQQNPADLATQSETTLSAAAAPIPIILSAESTDFLHQDTSTIHSMEAKRASQHSLKFLQQALFWYIMLRVLDVMMKIK